MTSTSVRALAQSYAYDRADDTQLQFHYTDLIRRLAQNGWFVQISLLSVDGATGVFTLPDTGVAIIGAFYGDITLDRTTKTELESIDTHWQNENGTPKAYLVENEDRKTFRLYPIPTTPSKNFSFIHGAPLGIDYPEYCVAVMHTTADPNAPEYLELPLALGILARDFFIESQRRDEPFSKLCEQLSSLFFKVLG